MDTYKIEMPSDLRGDWIWSASEAGRRDVHLFFRREFTLDPGMHKVELWLGAMSECHLRVNGRHISYGPPPPPRDSLYLELHDNIHFEPGRNVIAACVRNCETHTLARPRRPGGFWCQLNVNGKPFLWTNPEWEVLQGSYYQRGTPRRGPGLDFCEAVVLAEYPDGWDAPGADTALWTPADRVADITALDLKLAPSPLPPGFWEMAKASPAARGVFGPRCAATHVSFAELPCRPPCVFAAETFVYAESAARLRVAASADSPFKLFVNDALAIASGESGPHIHSPSDAAGASGFLSHAEVALDPGWNRFMVARPGEPDASGFALILPDTGPADVEFRSRPDSGADPGWMVAGPLKLPFHRVNGALRVERLVASRFSPDAANVSDAAALYASVEFVQQEDFDPFEGMDKSIDMPPVKLREGEYCAFDLEGIKYGFPTLSFESEAGAIVDILLGCPSRPGEPPSPETRIRSVDTLVCNAGAHSWTRFSPVGTSNMVACVRKASSGGVTLLGAGVQCVTPPFGDSAAFACSEPEVNAVWSASLANIRAAVAAGLADDPLGGPAQHLATVLPLSLAALYGAGDFKLTRKALREFADSQCENGLMPCLSSGDFDSDDCFLSLLWPVWLHYYYLSVGDKSLLGELCTNLEMFHDNIAVMAAPGKGLLSAGAALVGRTALLPGDTGGRPFSTIVNCLLCRCLLSSASLYRSMEMPERSVSLEDAASAVAKKIRGCARNPDTGLFHDAFDPGRPDAPSPSASAQTNFMALFSGVAKPAEFDAIFSAFHGGAPDPGGSDFDQHPLHEFLLLETACLFGHRGWALSRLKRNSGDLAVCHSKPVFGDATGREGRRAGVREVAMHSALPLVFLLKEMAGLRPAAPGFTQAYFSPDISMARELTCVLPTPYGRIRAAWSLGEEGRLSVCLESTYPVDILPQIPDEYAANCEIEVNANVKILAG